MIAPKYRGGGKISRRSKKSSNTQTISDCVHESVDIRTRDVIDVGVEILPMKELQQQMSSDVGYYEGQLYNLIREGRGVPAVPLILIGVTP